MAMTTTPFQREWIEIGKALGLEIELDHVVALADRTVTVPVLLKGYGAEQGMLLVTDFGVIADAADGLVDLGYGFSCLGEPSGRPIDRAAVEDMLRDWGAWPPAGYTLDDTNISGLGLRPGVRTHPPDPVRCVRRDGAGRRHRLRM